MPEALHERLLSASPSLGALLQDHRRERGVDEWVVADRCGLAVRDITSLEADRPDLDTVGLSEAVWAYRIGRTRFPEGRCRVVVDLVAGAVSVVRVHAPVTETSGDRTLLAYLELLCAATGRASFAPVPITSLDLAVLRGVLSTRQDAVHRHLEELLAHDDDECDVAVDPRRRLLLATLLVAGSGVLAATTAIAMVQSGGGEPSTSGPQAVVVADAPGRVTGAQLDDIRVASNWPDDWTVTVEPAPVATPTIVLDGVPTQLAAESVRTDVSEPLADAPFVEAAAFEPAPDAAGVTPAVAVEIGEAVRIERDPSPAEPTPVEIGEAVRIERDPSSAEPTPVEIGEATQIVRTSSTVSASPPGFAVSAGGAA